MFYDPTLYNRLNATVNEFQGLVNQVAQGKGTLGKLFSNEELYHKANATVDKLNVVIDDINAGKGSAGKFLKDPHSTTTPTPPSPTRRSLRTI